MPQLDALSFFSQLFWFFLIFFILYYYIVNSVIPYISTIFKIRNRVKYVTSTEIVESHNNPYDIVLNTLFNNSKKSEFVLHTNAPTWVIGSLTTAKELTISDAYMLYLENISDNLLKNKA